MINSQLSEGTQQLLIDMSGLCSADSTSIWFLLLTARTMKMHGGSMVLIRPKPAVVRVLTLVDEGQVITIRSGAA